MFGGYAGKGTSAVVPACLPDPELGQEATQSVHMRRRNVYHPLDPFTNESASRPLKKGKMGGTTRTPPERGSVHQERGERNKLKNKCLSRSYKRSLKGRYFVVLSEVLNPLVSCL